jgi:hypothetical protein
MHIEHIELLAKARELHNVPRGTERFREYIQLITGGGDDVDAPPLVAMNPMGREHVAARLDELIALGAERAAAEALREAERRLPDEPGTFKHGLALADDLRGGWTNRYTSEAGLLFGEDHGARRGWISTVLWVSDTPAPETVRAAVLCAAYRALHKRRLGPPKTLEQVLRQEGRAAAFAGLPQHLEPDDLAYSREVLQPYLCSDDYPTCFTAMFGDSAARAVGYPPLGLSDRAGFGVALNLGVNG